MGDGRLQSGDGRDVPLAGGRPVRSVGAAGGAECELGQLGSIRRLLDQAELVLAGRAAAARGGARHGRRTNVRGRLDCRNLHAAGGVRRRQPPDVLRARHGDRPGYQVPVGLLGVRRCSGGVAPRGGNLIRSSYGGRGGSQDLLPQAREPTE